MTLSSSHRIEHRAAPARAVSCQRAHDLELALDGVRRRQQLGEAGPGFERIT